MVNLEIVCLSPSSSVYLSSGVRLVAQLYRFLLQQNVFAISVSHHWRPENDENEKNMKTPSYNDDKP